ncbi:MAG: diguanylate cyclase [Sedimentisphaerales bacterium]|nr:diguanylate cyclase [Sedimentisphaerales bacterium]
MAGFTKTSKQGGDSNRKILLVGKLSSVFLDNNAAKELRCHHCKDEKEALEAAKRNSFDIVAVTISSLPGQFDAALQAIRSSNPDAKIILLAQMYEEPAAIRILDWKTNGIKLADDYLICPISSDRLHRLTSSDLSYETESQSTPTVLDTADEERIRQLERLATEDDLTGLKNRRYIWEFSKQIIEYTKTENGHVTLMVFDIDNFKHYNDVYGHLAGDDILRQAAVLMRRCCRGHDVVGRIGGDEFAVVFWDLPQNRQADIQAERRSSDAEHPGEPIFIAERFRRELKKAELHLLGPEGKGVLTISGGLATYPHDGLTIDELFKNADKALMQAKKGGKNRIYLVGRPQK